MVQGLRVGRAGAGLGHCAERGEAGGRGGGRAGGGGRGRRQEPPRHGPLVDDGAPVHQRRRGDGGRHEGAADLREVQLTTWVEKETEMIRTRK